jgi:signal transduction histidine kinase
MVSYQMVGNSLVGNALVRHPLVGHPLERHSLERHPLVRNALVGHPMVGHPLELGGVGVMRRWVLAIAGTHGVLAVGLLVMTGSWALGGSTAALIGCAAAFGLVGLVPMHLELRRHACTVVVTEAVLVVALLRLGPLGVVVAATVGEAMSCVASRQPRLKLLFNVAAALGASATAAAVYAAVATTDADVLQLRGWLPVAAAVAAFAVISAVTTSAILSVAERRRFLDVFFATATTVAASSAASASLGLSAAVLAQVDNVGPVLLAPLLALVFLGTRRMAVQSAEHLRFQRLYEASSRTSKLAGFEDALARLADEARGLVTGSSSVCIGLRPDGSWIGTIVDDSGVRPAEPELVEALLALPADGHRMPAVTDWPRALRTAMASAADLVWAAPRHDAKARVGLAVFREIGSDDQKRARTEVLAAFAGHAALTIANALLYEEVEEALRHQIDLTQQKGEFLATVSHELRTPLTCVLGAVSTLRRCRGRLDELDEDRLLGTALEQGDRLKRLIEDLLQVASTEHGDMRPDQRPIEVASLVAGVVGDLAGTSGQRLAAQVDPGCPDIRSDLHRVRQILTNLVENAIKYAPSGPIEVLARPAPAAVDLLVVDHGPGIPRGDRERVFERFVQLDQSSTRRQGGTGLGLYLCRQLAGLLDGTLLLEETAGGGCTFRLRLPVLPTTEEASADRPGASESSVLVTPVGVH